MAEQIVVSRRTGRGIIAATAIGSVSLVLSLVTSTYLVSHAYVVRGEQPDLHGRTLTVTGSAKTHVTSDLALWTVHVAGEGQTIEEAYDKLSSATESVRSFLTAKGFPEGSVELTAIGTQVHSKHVKHKKGDEVTEEEVFVSYELSRSFDIRTTEVERVAKAAGEVTEILKTGVHMETYAPSFVYTGLDELKVKMIGEATANARERADTIASGSKCRIGSVKEARAGVLQITPPWSTEVSEGGVNDTSTIEKQVTAVVHLTLMIEPAS
jgi:hypothetical protein